MHHLALGRLSLPSSSCHPSSADIVGTIAADIVAGTVAAGIVAGVMGVSPRVAGCQDRLVIAAEILNRL